MAPYNNNFFQQNSNISQYAFVKMKYFAKCGCEGELILLVDENFWIHDYKVTFDKIAITEYTTQAHFDNKKNNISFKFRDELLKMLGFVHKPNLKFNLRKDYKTITDNEKIKKINDLFWEKWHHQTFPNIDYVFTGSNPSGGMGQISNSTYWTIFKNGDKKFPNFTLQSLLLKHSYQEKDYLEIWENCINYNTFDFETWINGNHQIKTSFDWFNDNLSHPINEWKNEFQKIKNRYCEQKNKYEQVCNCCLQYRSEIQNQLKQNKQSFVINFWDNTNIPNIDIIEFAHIKPVYLIKNECFSKNNPKILEEIKNKYNIIPLSPSMHRLYDRKKIYWSSKNGTMQADNNLNVKIDSEFKNIPSNSLKLVQPFLLEYESKVLNRH